MNKSVKSNNNDFFAFREFFLLLDHLNLESKGTLEPFRDYFAGITPAPGGEPLAAVSIPLRLPRIRPLLRCCKKTTELQRWKGE